jgi:hypothetical protein
MLDEVSLLAPAASKTPDRKSSTSRDDMNTSFNSFLLYAIGRAKHGGVVEARTLSLESDQDHKRVEANATLLL